MNLQDIEEPIFSPEHTPYVAIGGDAKVRAIVERFYDQMDVDPRYKEVRATHHPTLDDARDKLYWFLSGWLGGPQLYIEKFGHPRLRARHMPFSIGIVERDEWIACMAESLDYNGVDPKLKSWLIKQLFATADWMRNRAE